MTDRTGMTDRAGMTDRNGMTGRMAMTAERPDATTVTAAPPMGLPRPRHPAPHPSGWLPVAGLAVAVAAFPAGNISVPGLGVALILPAAAAAVALAAAALLAAGRHLITPSPILAFAAAAVAVGALAVTAAPDAALALRLTGTAVVGLVFAVITATVCRRTRYGYALLAVLLVVGVGLCAASLRSTSQLQADFGGAVVTGRLTGVFGQPNELGAFAAVIAVLALAVLSTSRRTTAMVATAVVLAVAVAALAFSLSRGAWLGAAGGGAVVFLGLRNARRRIGWSVTAATLAWGVIVLANPGVAAAPAGGAWATVTERAATIVESGANPFDERPAIWREGLRQVESAPVLGHGPGNFPVLAAEASTFAPGIEAGHAHNMALTTASESGLLGLGLMVGAVLTGVLAVGRVVRGGAEATLAVTAAAGLAVVLVQGAVDYPLRNAVLAILTWLLVGLLAAATTTATEVEP
jgi:putative inorganic carbon (hco3(-)) transporter